MIIPIIICVAVLAFVLFMLYCMLVVASMADDEISERIEKSKGEKVDTDKDYRERMGYRL